MYKIGISSYKGGVGKTTTAICLATLLAQEAKAVLVVDSDPNRSALLWARENKLPFTVCSEKQSTILLSEEKFDFLIFDTPGRPSDLDIQDLAAVCDLLILPTTPDTMSIDLIVRLCRTLPPTTNYRLLVTNSPPAPQKDGAECRAGLLEAGLPVMQSIIRSYKCYKYAVDRGIPVEASKPKGGVAWSDWKKFRKELKELGL